ncbi:PAS domain S-box protein [Metabacillus herbersteinensis]|uniref:histidine kinase n=1 Tax=Metabacillus herbersteinensis TaxID=283816 RepID=A0ABV6G9W7_9BACI
MKQMVEVSKTKLMSDELAQLKLENEHLKQELTHSQIIFEQALDAIMIFDQKMNFIDVNAAACEMFQLPKEELKKRKLFDFLGLVSEEELTLQIDKLSTSGALSEELTLKLDNGDVKFVEYSAKKNAFGVYDLSIMRDATARKMLERERTINEQLFKDLFHRAVDGIVIFDQSGCFVDANGSFCSSFEIDKSCISSHSLGDFVEEENTYKIEKLWSCLKDNGKAKGELPVLLKSGAKKIFEFTTTSNILNGFYMSIMRDITEKRTMELKLYKSEERFREIFENAIDAIMMWDNNGYIRKVNQSASRTFELPEKDLIKSNIVDFMDPHDPRFKRVKKEYFKTGAIREELLFYMPNGQWKELEFTSKMDVIDGHHLTIFRNVSDRKRMEKDLRESEQKFRKIFDGSMDGIILFDNNYNIIDANPVASKILELPFETLRQYNLYDLVNFYQRMESLRTDIHEWKEVPLEVPFKFKNGHEKILEFSLKRNINANMNLAVFRDVTERKELEERLKKSDTLHVVGELAAGIAHEIRNPMTALKGFIQLLQGSVKEDFSMYFNVITSELSRIESIITEFLVLAKPQAIQYLEKDVARIMRETLDLLNAQALLANVQIHLNKGEDLPSIYCEPNQLKQVFINILKNAIEVMPEGGNITVKVEQKDCDHLQVSIKDEGSGISEGKLKRLGEPFYTTKDRGTGLGLMVSYKIVEEHHGTVEVESEVGKGTTFHISLPIQQK